MVGNHASLLTRVSVNVRLPVFSVLRRAVSLTQLAHGSNSYVTIDFEDAIAERTRSLVRCDGPRDHIGNNRVAWDHRRCHRIGFPESGREDRNDPGQPSVKVAGMVDEIA